SYEIIIIDNGSSCPYDINDIKENNPNTRDSTMIISTKSPISALIHGIAISRGDTVCAFIDAARIASPNLLKLGIMACESSGNVVSGALSYHIGHEPQNISVKKGYNQSIEDSLIALTRWEKDGYELFDISSYDPSSRFGFYSCPAETNSLFMSKEMWSESGGFDSAFVGPGGGLANLDLWKRVCDNRAYKVIMLLGEGTFHQFHGGITTNSLVDNWVNLHDEYLNIRGEPYSTPSIVPFQLGIPNSRAIAFSIRNK
ncbi:glycosyltransferase, partial [Methylobacterium sp. WL8]|uniref:glycosyltransferase n=1 Tax=Methylobacterium sp. WL8 TaxID=2603899 RepID=UPI0011C739D1